MRRLSFKTSTKMATKKGGVINVSVHLLSPRASKEVVHGLNLENLWDEFGCCATVFSTAMATTGWRMVP